MKALKIQYPWAELPVGGAFFVPTLTPAPVIQKGLQASIGTGIIPDKPCVVVQEGKFGVLFRRKA